MLAQILNVANGMGTGPVTGPYGPYPGETGGGGNTTVGGKGPKTVAKAVKSGGKTLLATKSGRTCLHGLLRCWNDKKVEPGSLGHMKL